MVAGIFAQGMIQSPPHQVGRVTMPQWPSVTVKQAAEQTGYNAEYIRRLVRQGRIEAELLGTVYLIKVSSLQAYVDEMKARDNARAGPKEKGK